jgi:hypothetical protein
MITRSEEKFLNNYKEEVQHPAWRFILRYALAWTLVMVPLTLAYDYFNGEIITAKEVLLLTLIQFAGGLGYGSWFQWFVKTRVKKIENKLAEN